MRSASGQPISLAEEIGRGGEGAVYAVRGVEHLVAKVYSKPVSGDRADKLSQMVAERSERLLRLCAWPVDTIYDSGRLVGFLMERIVHHRDIHTLYGPRSRIREFPEAGYGFLVHAATNLARAFSVVHEHGHVIGDVNDKFALVSSKAMVKLIDCDSFQVHSGGRYFLCEVGVPTFQPPEIHRLGSYQGLRRTSNHDNFGLAVLIFQLLFLARHPFSGTPRVAGELPIDRAIRELRFAYGRNSIARGIAAPPNSLSMAAVTPEVAEFFEKAFSEEGIRSNRPTADEWVSALGDLSNQLGACKANPLHHYLKRASACPLCRIESMSGVMLFLGTAASAPLLTGADAIRNAASVWQVILRVPRPTRAPNPPSPGDFSVTARPLGPDPRRNGLALAIISVVVGLLMFFSIPVLGFLILVFAAWVYHRGPHPEKEQRVQERDRLRRQYGTLLEKWHDQCGSSEFDKLLAELEEARRALERLPERRNSRIREAELNAYLERRYLRRASIQGIGPVLTAALESFGVETAADVTGPRILAVPGIGAARAEEILQWKRRCEDEFRRRYDPNRPSNPAAVRAVDAALSTERDRLASKLRQGPSNLRQASSRIAQDRENLRRELETTARRLAQAEADAGI